MSKKMQTASSLIQVGQLTPGSKPLLAGASSSLHAPTESPQEPTQIELSGLDETVWLGSPLTYKGRDEYEAFMIKGVTIKKHSFVYIRGDRGQHHLAYIKNMYDENGKKLIKIWWFWQQDELIDKSILKRVKVIPEEIFIERATQVVSVCCVDFNTIVLTLRDWKRFSVTNPAVQSRAYMCRQELKGNKLSSYDISELQGYHLQDAFD